MPWGSAIAAVGAIGSAAINSGGSSGANAAGQQAADYRQQASDLWNNLTLPNIQYQPYQNQVWQGDYTSSGYDPSIGSVTQVQDSPAARQAEVDSINQLSPFAKGGLTPSDIANLNQIQRTQLGAGASGAKGIISDLASRGQAGSGATEMAQLASDQGAADSSASSYTAAMQAAMSRQMDAIKAGVADNAALRGQDTSLSKQMADIANTFNSQTSAARNAAASFAASARNTAAAATTTGKQNVANTNTATGNTNITRQNETIPQLNFTDAQAKIAGQSAALVGQSQQASAQQAALSQNAAGQEASGLNAVNAVSKAVNQIFPQNSTSTNGNVSAANGGGTVTDANGNLVDQSEG